MSAWAAYVFPGQASQKVGMGLSVYQRYASARAVFDQADATLGFPVSRLCFEGPAEDLTKTINVQPALVATSLACLRAAQEGLGNKLPHPAFMAGHSLGEYTALAATSALSFADALLLVRERGRLMYEAGLRNPGGMLAVIAFDRATLQEVCAEAGVEISNVNAPGQLVISGAVDKLERASQLAKARGARRLIPLNVSGAFHSTLMDPVLAEFDRVLQGVTFRAPSVPVISNVTALPLTSAAAIRQELLSQLRHCIQWQSSVEYMTRNGVSTYYEIGPGTVLAGLIKRISPETQTINIAGVDDIVAIDDPAPAA
ncbi:MAG: ACP S-malonyltransferase [Dehalococcoidia bacterium]|jgi:[acyl-carrier-protein] S-malonyltransferase|nr:ACP S-malonyltransferase [Dehalococcoidia bacterium]